MATASSFTLRVGQTVTLKCQSGGVPTPLLTWYQPDGNEIFTKKEITVQVVVNINSNFGNFKRVAENGLTPPDEKIISAKFFGHTQRALRFRSRKVPEN